MHYLFEDLLYEFYYYSEELWGMLMFYNGARNILILVLALVFLGKIKEERDRKINYLSLKIGGINANQ